MITNGDIMAMCPCIAHIYCDGAALAGAIKDGGRRGGPSTGKAVPGTPYPRGGGKTGGVFQSWVGYILQPFKTTFSKQGGTGKTGGGMIFEQVCKK